MCCNYCCTRKQFNKFVKETRELERKLEEAKDEVPKLTPDLTESIITDEEPEEIAPADDLEAQL